MVSVSTVFLLSPPLLPRYTHDTLSTHPQGHSIFLLLSFILLGYTAMLFLISEDIKREMRKCIFFICWNFFTAIMKIVGFILIFFVTVKIVNDGKFSLTVFLFMVFCVLCRQMLNSLSKVGKVGREKTGKKVELLQLK